MKHRPPASAGLFAFTLIELLVVVAIIGILAALSIPAISGVMKRGNITKSASNLKAIATASMTWQADNGMVLPHLYNDYAGNAKPWWQQYWSVQLLPYLGLKEPTSAADLNAYAGKRPPGALADPLSKQKVPTGNAHWQLSDYGRNPAVAQFPGTPPSPSWDPIQIRYKTAAAALTQPSKIIMYLPSYDLYPDVYVSGGTTLARDVSRYGPTNARTAIPVAFFDGHVELLPRGEIEGATNQTKWYGDFTN